MFSLRHHEFLLNVNLAAIRPFSGLNTRCLKSKRKKNSGDRGEFPERGSGSGSGRAVSRAGTGPQQQGTKTPFVSVPAPFACIPVWVKFSAVPPSCTPVTATLLGCFGNSDQHLAGLWLIQVARPELSDLPLASRGHLPR